MVLKFCQRVLKFWRINIRKFSANWHRPLVDCHVDDVITTFKHYPINILLFGLMITQVLTRCFYGPNWNGRRMMMFGSLHFWLAIINYNWFLTIWLVILFFERKKIVKQKWLKGWDNFNWKNSSSMKIQYGGDKSSSSCILLLIFFLLCILFWSSFVAFVNLWFHSRLSCIVLLYVCRYNQIDRHLKSKALQYIIFGELKGTCLL